MRPTSPAVAAKDGVRVVSGETVLVAYCDACGWTPSTGSYHGIRMAARRHAAAHGHVVRVDARRIHYYDGR